MKNKSKKKRAPRLEANKWNKLTGKELVEMGFRQDAEGVLISNTSTYEVMIQPGSWHIKRAAPDQTIKRGKIPYPLYQKK